MTKESDTSSEREDIEALLPWYVTGRLDAASRAQVDAYLERHPGMRRQLVLVEEDRDAAWSANAKIAPPRTLNADHLLERARGPRPASGAKSIWTAPLDVVREFFAAPTATGVRWAAAAAVVIMLAQSAVIGGLVGERPQVGYETASGGGAKSSDGARVLVRFQKDARLDAIAAALASLDMTIVDGPRPGELFVVRIADASATEAETVARTAKLRELSTLVAVVLPMGP